MVVLNGFEADERIADMARCLLKLRFAFFTHHELRITLFHTQVRRRIQKNIKTGVSSISPKVP